MYFCSRMRIQEKWPEFAPSGKLFHTLKASREWGRMLEIGTIGALNDAIAEGRMQEIILTQEALFEERIGHLADTIVKSGGKKFIMIAGPSFLRKDHLFTPPFYPACCEGIKAASVPSR